MLFATCDIILMLHASERLVEYIIGGILAVACGTSLEFCGQETTPSQWKKQSQDGTLLSTVLCALGAADMFLCGQPHRYRLALLAFVAVFVDASHLQRGQPEPGFPGGRAKA
ncbi:unnamed protein product [Prorocentrum cordatum]|uniref:Transmembrane protein 107 n=1 Tax=Prorocentrum cordatum TaxID=2364126 RepID=A0ABN9TM19_9DINO|nr:unnamed protein product [Polarella glacialis]